MPAVSSAELPAKLDQRTRPDNFLTQRHHALLDVGQRRVPEYPAEQVYQCARGGEALIDGQWLRFLQMRM
jgi:hypothetical protein